MGKIWRFGRPFSCSHFSILISAYRRKKKMSSIDIVAHCTLLINITVQSKYSNFHLYIINRALPYKIEIILSLLWYFTTLNILRWDVIMYTYTLVVIIANRHWKRVIFKYNTMLIMLWWKKSEKETPIECFLSSRFFLFTQGSLDSDFDNFVTKYHFYDIKMTFRVRFFEWITSLNELWRFHFIK